MKKVLKSATKQVQEVQKRKQVQHSRSLNTMFKPMPSFDGDRRGTANSAPNRRGPAATGRRGPAHLYSESRSKLCRHFLRGSCPFGDDCAYAHDISAKMPNEQKVFIRGIPRGCTSRHLIAAVEKAGFKVINIPKIHPHGFAPRVCLESVEAAKELLKIARIDIEGHVADVFKYKNSRSTNTDNAAVVVSGLPEGTTGYQLLQGLTKAGFLIERSPLVAAGCTVCERCEMATVEQAESLVAIESIECLGTKLSFTPFSCVDRVTSRTTSMTPPSGPGGFGRRSPRPTFSTSGGGRRLPAFGIMNRALGNNTTNLSCEG